MNITEKSDVYSYGVVLLEILSGRNAIENQLMGDGQHIVEWVKKKMGSFEPAVSVLDAKLQGLPDQMVQEMLQTLGIAMFCVNSAPSERPTMKEVVALLMEQWISRMRNRVEDILGVDLAEAIREDGEDGHGCARELRFDFEMGSDYESVHGGENLGSDYESVHGENVVDGEGFTTPKKGRQMVQTVFSVEEEIPPPILGMVFGSWDELDTYFWSCARQKGFGIVRAASGWVKVKKELGTGKCCKQRRNAKWTCDCYGRPSRKRKVDPLKEGLIQDEETVVQRKTKKCGCEGQVCCPHLHWPLIGALSNTVCMLEKRHIREVPDLLAQAERAPEARRGLTQLEGAMDKSNVWFLRALLEFGVAVHR
uniref:Protein kinase domain-containing protein n=1 Tax=Chenopodium quinoa TaxID=63459 RepID=A0A803MT87_CHEQI